MPIVAVLRRSVLTTVTVALTGCGAYSGYRSMAQPVVSASAPNQVVLVTGASGFLGQHIVKLLHQRAPSVSEIRVFDTDSFIRRLAYTESKPVKVYIGDVTHFEDVKKAVEGVDVVIHAAAVIDVSPQPDTETMNAVNVEGTQNVIRACCEQKVKHLVYTSTTDVIVGFDDVVDADETTEEPAALLFPGYGHSKKHGEAAVLRANSTSGPLTTIALRTPAMYGEGDKIYVPSALRNAAKNKGVMHQLSKTSSCKHQNVYVGNFAWAHILAAGKLAEDQRAGGQVYIITDDTPAVDITSFMQPFLQARGFSVSKREVPYSAVYYAAWLLETASKLISLVYPVPPPIHTAPLTYISRHHTYKRTRAEERLSYKPLYTPEMAMANSLSYYKNLDLKLV